MTNKIENTHQLSHWLMPHAQIDSIVNQLDKHNAPYEVKSRFNGEGKKEWAVYVPKREVNYDYVDKPLARRSC